MMDKKKFKKLINNPDRFFFDLFAKRIGAGDQKVNLISADAKRSSYLLPEGFSCSKDVHPWVQIAKKYNLRSGAKTGVIDQSIIIPIEKLHSVLMYACWLGNALNMKVRFFSQKKAFILTLKELDLLDLNCIDQVFSKLKESAEFTFEFIGAFENNFACHLFVSDTGSDGSIILRSNQVFLKKCLPDIFYKAYPIPFDKDDNWDFDRQLPVDIVYTWVNKDDPHWRGLWEATYPESSIDLDRFSSKDELRYSLRSIEKYIPWCRNIFIVSNCAEPEWLNKYSKVQWIDHKEIYPDASVLPVFNSHSIESVLHRIEGLSENFLYFNDDVFVNAPTYINDFIDQAGRSFSFMENYGMIFEDNFYEDKKDYFAPSLNSVKMLSKIFPRYRACKLHKHTPHVLKKSTLFELEGLFRDVFDFNRASKKRSLQDVNVTSFLFHHYSIVSGKSIEADVNYMIVRPGNIEKLSNLKMREFKFLCFNDGGGSAGNMNYLKKFDKVVGELYPSPSMFEIDAY